MDSFFDKSTIPYFTGVSDMWIVWIKLSTLHRNFDTIFELSTLIHINPQPSTGTMWITDVDNFFSM